LVSLARGDLASIIYGAIAGRVETIFDDSVSCIEQTEQQVRVTFERGSQRDFDLVVGADGLHSRVRELVFGHESRFEKYLGYQAAAFEIEGYRPRDESTYVMYTEPHQQVARFAMRGDRTMFLFTFADAEAGAPTPHSLSTQKALLRQRFGRSGWECPRILEALDACSNLYFDRVSQIHIPPRDGLWTRGRVTLIGDAASGVSLLAGQGSALAMTAAYILAGELHKAGDDYAKAFQRYQELFAPFVSAEQKAALRFADLFAPKSSFALFVRNQILNLLRAHWFADLMLARELQDNLALPEYVNGVP